MLGIAFRERQMDVVSPQEGDVTRTRAMPMIEARDILKTYDTGKLRVPAL